MYLVNLLSSESYRPKVELQLLLSFLQREVIQKNNLLAAKDTLIGEKDHRVTELTTQLVRQQEVRLHVIQPLESPVHVCA